MRAKRNRKAVTIGAVVALIAALAIAGTTYAVGVHKGIFFTHEYVKGVTSKTVALTIDDGPHPIYTPQVLDLLQEHHAHATFFLVGRQATAHADIARRTVDEGNEVGNHTMTHVGWQDFTYEQARDEISNAEAAITAATGQAPVFFRAPKGQNNMGTARAVEESGLEPVTWSIGLEHQASPTAADEAHRVADAVTPGMIILAHDGGTDRSKSVEALGILLDDLDKQGYKVVTLSELLSEGDGFATMK